MGLRGLGPSFPTGATQGGRAQVPKTGGSLRPIASKI
jgi:hypothetical protein